MQATEPNIPAIVEQIAEQFQGQPRDRFAKYMQEIAYRFEVEEMEANGAGPETKPCSCEYCRTGKPLPF